VSPDALDFATGVCIPCQPITKTFTVTNNGGGRLVGSAQINPGGENFSISAGGDFDLGPGEEQQVSVSFTSPNYFETFTGSVSVTSNGGSGIVSLSGHQ
jgi:hypothetical protein